MFRFARAAILLALGFSICGIVLAGEIPITTSSEEARALFIQARDLAERFRAAEGRDIYKQALAIDPDFALAHRDLSVVQPSLKEARESIAQAVALAGYVSECERHWILATDAGNKLDFQRQREQLGMLVEKCAEDTRAHAALGLYYFARQYYDSAALEFQKSVDLDSRLIASWNMLGYARRSLNDLDGAGAAFVKYVELDPQNANPYDSHAELLLKQGKFEESIARYREALKVDPTFNLSRFGVAAPLVYLGRYDDARNELEDMIQKAHDDGERQQAYFGIACTYADQGKVDDAVAAVTQSSALAEKISDVAQVSQNCATIGFLRLEEGRYDEALANYERALEMVNSSELAPTIKAFTERNLLYAKARIASAKGQADEAGKIADVFSEQSNATGSISSIRAAHELYGILALDRKDYARAIEELKQANLQSGQNLYRLALAYQATGDKQQAAEQIKAAAHRNTVLNLNDVLARQKAVELAATWSGK